MTKLKLGELLGIAREVRGLTLRDLERRTRISNALISQIETGKVKDPSFRNVVRLAHALGVKLERLAETAFDPADYGLRGGRK